MSFHVALMEPGSTIAATVLRRHEAWSTAAVAEPAAVEVAYECSDFLAFEAPAFASSRS